VDLTADEIRRAPAVDGGFDWGDRTDVANIRPFRHPTFWRTSY